MGDHPRRPLTEMRTAADRLVVELAPFCDRLEIAGSIRRQRREVSDIELVAIPKFGTARRLGELLPRTDVDLLDAHVRDLLLATDRWRPRLDKDGRPALGDRYKRLLVDGIPLDLFVVLPPASFAVLFLIRTGSADFTRAMVTQRRKGGHLPDDCQVRDGAVWQRGEQVALADEAAWFRLCGMTFVPPEQRR